MNSNLITNNHNANVSSVTVPKQNAMQKKKNEIDRIINTVYSQFWLVKNALGSKYLVCKADGSIVLFSDPDLIFFIKNLAFGDQVVLENTLIKNALEIIHADANNVRLRGNELFVRFGYSIQQVNNPISVQVINQVHLESFLSFYKPKEQTMLFMGYLLYADNEIIKKELISIGFSERHYLIVFTWLVSALSLPYKFTLLELVSEDRKQLAFIQEQLKALIDPTPINIHRCPVKAQALDELAVNNHLISITANAPIKDEVQARMADLLIGQAKVTLPNAKSPFAASFLVKRPILMTAKSSQITDETLKEATITIRLPKSSPSQQHWNVSSLLSSALFIANKVVSNHNVFVGSCSFYEIGLKVCQALNLPVTDFKEQFNQLETDRLMTEINANPVAAALFSWAQANLGSEETKTVLDWMIVLKAYEDEERDDFPKTAKSTGRLLTDAQSLLEPYGIEIIKKGDKINGTYHRTIKVPAKLAVVDKVQEIDPKSALIHQVLFY